MRTSGMAVVFSGVTVIVALAGLFLIDAKVVRSMAIGAIVVVAIAVLAAVTLLPALIAVLGAARERAGQDRRQARGATGAPKPGPGFWERWTATLMKRPLPFAIGATALMLLIASPALSLKLDNAAIAQFPKDFETRVGLRPRGAGGRARARWARSSTWSLGASPAELAQIGATLKRQPDVAEVSQPVSSADGSKTLVHDRAGQGAGERARATRSSIACATTCRCRPARPPCVGGAAAQNQDFAALDQRLAVEGRACS